MSINKKEKKHNVYKTRLVNRSYEPDLEFKSNSIDNIPNPI